MLAALLEWFLWVAAFTYCLVKVFQKAEQISVRLLSVFFGILFFCLR
jgi:chitin synthase